MLLGLLLGLRLLVLGVLLLAYIVLALRNPMEDGDSTVCLIIIALSINVAISLAVLAIATLSSAILRIKVLAAVVALLLVVGRVITTITLAWLESLCGRLE